MIRTTMLQKYCCYQCLGIHPYEEAVPWPEDESLRNKSRDRHESPTQIPAMLCGGSGSSKVLTPAISWVRIHS